jgi:cobalt/nickel transport system permease protein
MSLFCSAVHIDDLERMAAGDSPVHALHPGVKITVTLVYVVTVVSFPPAGVSGMAVFVLYPALLMPLSGTRWRALLPRLCAALPFALLGAVSNLLMFRETVLYAGSFAVSRGLLSFISIMMKTLLSVFAVLLLIATTPFTTISYQLTRMGVPKIAALQLVMTYRYIGTLLREAGAMFTTYTLRSPASRGVLMKDMGTFVGQLVFRSFDRAARVYAAMCCRGFDGVYRSAEASAPLRLSEAACAALISVLIIAARFWNVSRAIGALAGKR